MEALKKFKWSLGLRGLAAVLFGILALAWPGITLLVLIILFGVFALIDGLLALGGWLMSPGGIRGNYLVPVLGIIGIVAGILAFVWPAITALALLLLIAARAIIVGILEIVAAAWHRKIIRRQWLLILGGALSVAFGLLVFLYPFAGALAIVWLIALYAVLVGLAQIAFAISAKDIVGRFAQEVAPPPIPT